MNSIRRPNILSLEKDAARQAFTAEPDIYYWMRQKTQAPSGQQDAEENTRAGAD